VGKAECCGNKEKGLAESFSLCVVTQDLPHCYPQLLKVLDLYIPSGLAVPFVFTLVVVGACWKMTIPVCRQPLRRPMCVWQWPGLFQYQVKKMVL